MNTTIVGDIRKLTRNTSYTGDHRFFVGVDSSKYRVRAPNGGALLDVSYKGGARPFYPNGEVVGGNLSNTDVFDVAYEPNGSFLYVATNSSSAVGDQVKRYSASNGEMVLDRGCKFSLGTTNLNPNITDFGLARSPQCKEVVASLVDSPAGPFLTRSNLPVPTSDVNLITPNTFWRDLSGYLNAQSSLSNRQELQGVGVASYRFEDEIWAAVNRADINGPSAGYSACVDLEDVSSPTLQTGPLRIGVSLSSSLSWRLESRTVRYQYRLQNNFTNFTWVLDWVPLSWGTEYSGSGSAQVIVDQDKQEASPNIGDTYRDFRLVLESSAGRSRYYVYVNDDLDKPSRFDPAYLSSAVDENGVFWQFSEDSSDGSIPDTEGELPVIYDVASAGGMATLFATEYGLYALEHNGVCSANPIGWEPIYVATTGSAVSSYQSSYDIKRLAVQPICADGKPCSKTYPNGCTTDLPSSLTPVSYDIYALNAAGKILYFGGWSSGAATPQVSPATFSIGELFNVVPLEDSRSVWLFA